MTKQKQINPLGPIHADSIRRVVEVPKARRGDYNTTPGTTEKPIIHHPEGEKKK